MQAFVNVAPACRRKAVAFFSKEKRLLQKSGARGKNGSHAVVIEPIWLIVSIVYGFPYPD